MIVKKYCLVSKSVREIVYLDYEEVFAITTSGVSNRFASNRDS